MCVHSLFPEQGEGKASAVVEAASQVAGSGAGGDVCGEEVSTPKRTESENQPFSSFHQTLCCAFGAAAPCPSKEPPPPCSRALSLQPNLWQPPGPRISPGGAGPDASSGARGGKRGAAPLQRECGSGPGSPSPLRETCSSNEEMVPPQPVRHTLWLQSCQQTPCHLNASHFNPRDC